MTFENTPEFAAGMDKADALATYRQQFYIPQHNGSDVLYFTGNSLGLQPKTARAAVEQEFADWEKYGVEGHFLGKNPWFKYHHFLTENAAKVVGAMPKEVVIMNNLTVNLHLMMVSFYRPQGKRNKIVMEAGAFPSDQYAMETQVRFHGLNPDDAIIELTPREGEYTLRTEDILKVIEDNADSIATVMMGGVNYYTGQAFDMQAIAQAAHKAGAMCGFDLAHAAGNLHLKLHDWDIDFAVWCSYKYLNSGPGGTSGVFVHERHCNNPELVRFAGWWGHDEESRFLMKKGFVPMEGAQGWQLSNAQVFPMAIHKASLEIFAAAGIENLRAKSEPLTAYLEFILDGLTASGKHSFTIITPRTAKDRGCQLSVLVKDNGRKLFDYLTENGVIADWREPNVIRMAPVPLYNSYTDIYKLGQVMAAFSV
jgi:kynureninase